MLSIHFQNPALDLKRILEYTNISVKKKVMMDGRLSKHYSSVKNDSLHKEITCLKECFEG
jgi:hypothetical protein